MGAFLSFLNTEYEGFKTTKEAVVSVGGWGGAVEQLTGRSVPPSDWNEHSCVTPTPTHARARTQLAQNTRRRDTTVSSNCVLMQTRANTRGKKNVQNSLYQRPQGNLAVQPCRLACTEAGNKYSENKKNSLMFKTVTAFDVFISLHLQKQDVPFATLQSQSSC